MALTTIQIRNVPGDVRRMLEVRAAQAGMSLSDYLLEEIAKMARRPTLEEVLERIDCRPRSAKPIDAAAEVRAEREERR